MQDFFNSNPSLSIELDRGSRASLQPEPLDASELLHPSLEFVYMEDRELLSENTPKLDDFTPKQRPQKMESMSIDSAKIDRLIDETRQKSQEEEKLAKELNSHGPLQKEIEGRI